MDQLSRAVIETARQPFLILDAASGRIEQANPYLADLLGYGVPDLVGRELWEIGFFRNRDAYRGVIRQLQETGYVRFEDLPLETRDGRGIEVEFVCNVYPVDGREMAQCNIRDVSERKRAERALRHAELKLRQSLKMEAVAKLAGGVAHEFNNLLTAINGYAAVSLSQPDPENRFHPHLSEILNAGERADPGQMEQVLPNLAMNPRKAMPQGWRLTMKTSRAEIDQESDAGQPRGAAKSYVLFSISDTCVGMDEEVRSRIFDPFYTAHALPGTPGLELSMVQGVIAQSGGHVVADSAPGWGATFKVFPPMVGAPAVGNT